MDENIRKVKAMKRESVECQIRGCHSKSFRIVMPYTWSYEPKPEKPNILTTVCEGCYAVIHYHIINMEDKEDE